MGNNLKPHKKEFDLSWWTVGKLLTCFEQVEGDSIKGPLSRVRRKTLETQSGDNYGRNKVAQYTFSLSWPWSKLTEPKGGLLEGSYPVEGVEADQG